VPIYLLPFLGPFGCPRLQNILGGRLARAFDEIEEIEEIMFSGMSQDGAGAWL
jgi:hypothetical protein